MTCLLLPHCFKSLVLDAISCMLGQIKSFFLFERSQFPSSTQPKRPLLQVEMQELLLLLVPPGVSIERWHPQWRNRLCCEYKALFQLLNAASLSQKSASSLLTSCCSLCLCFSLAAAPGNRRVGYIRRTAGLHLFVTLRGRQLVDKLEHILWEWRLSSAQPDSCKYCPA